MLKPRIIPCLLIHDNGLVKTEGFKNPKYIGDPINTVKIFNEKYADEIFIIDIDATVKNLKPNFELIKKLANECRMPFCYGGGIKSITDAIKIINYGVEKVALSSAAISNPSLLKDLADSVGSQSVVCVLDIKKDFFGNYKVMTHNGTKKIDKDFFLLLNDIENFGAGEIVINFIDKDGKMNGYDYDFSKKVRESVNLPLTILGGAGNYDHIKKLLSTCGDISAAAGSCFVFKGPFKAVLINYPSYIQKKDLFPIK